MRSNTEIVVNALLNNGRVKVATATRDFEGRVFQLFRSAYEDHLTAGVVEDGTGLVHFFRCTKDDAYIRPAP